MNTNFNLPSSSWSNPISRTGFQPTRNVNQGATGQPAPAVPTDSFTSSAHLEEQGGGSFDTSRLALAWGTPDEGPSGRRNEATSNGRPPAVRPPQRPTIQLPRPSGPRGVNRAAEDSRPLNPDSLAELNRPQAQSLTPEQLQQLVDRYTRPNPGASSGPRPFPINGPLPTSRPPAVQELIDQLRPDSGSSSGPRPFPSTRPPITSRPDAVSRPPANSRPPINIRPPAATQAIQALLDLLRPESASSSEARPIASTRPPQPGEESDRPANRPVFGPRSVRR